MNCNIDTFEAARDNKITAKDDLDVFISVPFVYLSQFENYFLEGIKKGAQDLSALEKGSYTGEISGDMLAEQGVEYVLTGHSERRLNFYETDETVNLKIKNALKSGLKPVLCIGESMKEREAGNYLKFLENQFMKGVADLDGSEIDVAYEPIWAIGTGKTANSYEIEEVLLNIKIWMTKKSITGRSIYGGSVTEDNAPDLAKIPVLDGFLVGKASLSAEFQNIINSL